jgi:hypothetical protein
MVNITITLFSIFTRGDVYNKQCPSNPYTARLYIVNARFYNDNNAVLNSLEVISIKKMPYQGVLRVTVLLGKLIHNLYEHCRKSFGGG